MGFKDNESKDVRELQLQIGYLREFTKAVKDRLDSTALTVNNVLNNNINLPAPPTSNLLLNGEVGHSVNSWFDAAYTTDDKSKEAAYWFSHDGTLSGIALDELDARVAGTHKTLKTKSHSSYDNNYSCWDSENGWAEITGLKTLDALLPYNVVDATTPLARVAMIAAKRNKYIEISDTCSMFAGIYDNTAGQLKFLTGSLGFAATLIGTPAASQATRGFLIHVITDRGFDLVSPEIVILNAPADGFFTESKNITMRWKPTSGQLRVDIYEYLPSLSQYRLIAEVSSGFSYIHQGSFLRTVSSYPASGNTVRQAVFYTRTGEIAHLATNGVSPVFDTVNFPIGVPDNYDKSKTTGRQWVRIGFTEKANLFVSGCTADGTQTITAPEIVFEAEYAANFAGLTALVYDGNDTLIKTTTITSRTSDTQILLADTITVGTNLKLRIVGGGFHGVIVDKIHLGYHNNTSYAPNALDSRTLQPVAAPASSTQGGVGGGGSGGGIYNCVCGATPIKMADGSWKTIEKANTGEVWASGEFQPNLLLKLRKGFDYVRNVQSANGVSILCTDTERFAVDRNDSNGTPLYRLRVGDTVLTEIDGRIEPSKISVISKRSGKSVVYTPVLSNNRLFIAGETITNRTIYGRIWKKVREVCFGEKLPRAGGFVLHNQKYEDWHITYNYN